VRTIWHSKRQSLDLAQDEFRFCQTQDFSILPSLGDHLGRHVHTDDSTVRTHPLSRQERVESGAAAKIEDRLTGLRISQQERVPYSAEGFGHGRWQGIDVAKVVTEPLGTLWSDRELRLLVR
jgi:hypothetical protein